MLEKLNALSTEALMKMKSGIEEILDSRLDRSIRIGSEVSFESGGVVHTGEVVRINIKTVGLIERSPTPGKRWRVSVNLLTVKPRVIAKQVSLPKANVPYKPVSLSDDAW